MSGVALLLHVGDTSVVVDMADHYTQVPVSNLEGVLVTCHHCGALVVDYEVHLVWHINRNELTARGGAFSG